LKLVRQASRRRIYVPRLLPRFIPGKEFKKALATVDFVKAPQNQNQ
jgi:hypothetical protein